MKNTKKKFCNKVVYKNCWERKKGKLETRINWTKCENENEEQFFILNELTPLFNELDKFYCDLGENYDN